jgi:hypothetical protein
MEDLPLDFTRYLGQRLGVSSEDAADLLSLWLKDYQPVSCRPADVGHRPAKAGDTGYEAMQHTA